MQNLALEELKQFFQIITGFITNRVVTRVETRSVGGRYRWSASSEWGKKEFSRKAAPKASMSQE
jgi:hypothetical protein